MLNLSFPENDKKCRMYNKIPQCKNTSKFNDHPYFIKQRATFP